MLKEVEPMVTVTVTAAIRLVGLPLEIVKVKVKFLETVVFLVLVVFLGSKQQRLIFDPFHSSHLFH